MTWGPSREFDAPKGGGGFKMRMKVYQGKDSEGLSVSALFEKFLIL